jgi:Uma2 family endonuclease
MAQTEGVRCLTTLLGVTRTSSVSIKHGNNNLTMNMPITIPISVKQYASLVERGDFATVSGQVELINGRIVGMNPQGPRHSDPIDVLAEWSIEQSQRRYTIRVQEPIEIPNENSCPEPDIAWVHRRRYSDRHPAPNEVSLVIEVSLSSGDFDKNEKMLLYAAANIPEYWQVDVESKKVCVYRDPHDSRYLSISEYEMESTIYPLCEPSAALEVKTVFAAS